MRIALPLIVASLAVAPLAHAEPPTASLRPVTDVPELAGRQAQLPLWAPGDVPRLVHEVTDRSKKTTLRVVAFDGGELRAYEVPGSRSSRLGTLGAGAARSDRCAAWWDGSSFFFLRSAGEGSVPYYFDGLARALPDAPAGVVELVPDPRRARIFVAVGDGDDVDVYAHAGVDLSSPGDRLSEGDGTVEHSLSVDSAGRLLFVVTSREETWIARADPASKTPPRQLRVPDREVLSVTAVPGTDLALAVARACVDLACAESEHVLLEQPLDSGPARVLATGLYVPPGLAPRPAVTPDGRFVYYVANDPDAGNPVVRLDRETGQTVAVQTGTRGNQEVAVARYSTIDGTAVDWLAVISVGDVAGDDVRNHLYVGPVGEWPGWEEPR